MYTSIYIYMCVCIVKIPKEGDKTAGESKDLDMRDIPTIANKAAVFEAKQKARLAEVHLFIHKYTFIHICTLS